MAYHFLTKAERVSEGGGTSIWFSGIFIYSTIGANGRRSNRSHLGGGGFYLEVCTPREVLAFAGRLSLPLLLSGAAALRRLVLVKALVITSEAWDRGKRELTPRLAVQGEKGEKGEKGKKE